jgi:hypothetical protein
MPPEMDSILDVCDCTIKLVAGGLIRKSAVYQIAILERSNQKQSWLPPTQLLFILVSSYLVRIGVKNHLHTFEV